MYAHWLGLHRENPSQQRFWPTDLYRHLWRSPGGRVETRKDGRVAVRAVLDFAQIEKVIELEAWCQDRAETVLALHDVEADEGSALRAAKAIAAQVQRASLTLAALARGEPDAASATACTPTPAAKPAQAVGLIELVEAWWREAERRYTRELSKPEEQGAGLRMAGVPSPSVRRTTPQLKFMTVGWSSIATSPAGRPSGAPISATLPSCGSSTGCPRRG